MKKVSKIASIFLALVMAVATPVLLTGCASSVSLEEASRAMVVAGENYSKSHSVYDKFEDSTVSLKSSYSSTSINEWEYYAKAGDTQKTKGEFADTTNGTEELKISVKNVTVGQGEDALETLHMCVTRTTNETSKQYYLDDDDLLKSETVTTVEVKTYTLGTVVAEGEVSYYVTLYTSEKEGNADAVVTKEYYEFEDEYEYMESLTSYLARVNQLVYNSYFLGGDMMEMVLMLAEFTKDGDKLTMNVGYAMPEVSEYGAMLIKYDMSVSFDGKKLGKVTVGMNMETPSNGDYKSNVELAFETSAAAITLSDPAADNSGYTEVAFELEVPNSMLPSSVGMEN